MIDSTFKPNPPTPKPERQRAVFLSQSKTAGKLRQVAGHVRADALVVEDTLNGADGAHGKVLIPQLAGSKVHNVLLGDLTNSTLNVLGAEATASGDDLATNVLGNGSGAVEGEENGGLELGLGALNLGGGDLAAQTRPLTQGEVDQVIKVGQVLRNEVDTPETII